jgi:hypothetical protein
MWDGVPEGTEKTSWMHGGMDRIGLQANSWARAEETLYFVVLGMKSGAWCVLG